MSVQLALTGKHCVTILSCYIPTMSNSNDIKEKFYEDLKATTGTVTKEDKFVILGDFNVKFGADYKTWEGV